MFRLVLHNLCRACELVVGLFTVSTACNKAGSFRDTFYPFSSRLTRNLFAVYSTGLRRDLTDGRCDFSAVYTGPTMLTTIFNKFRSYGGERTFQ